MRVLLIIGLLLIVVGALANETDVVRPGVPVNPEYPDETAVLAKYGTIHFHLSIDGVVTHHLNEETRVTTVNTVADGIITLAGATGTFRGTLRGKTIIKVIGKDGKTSTTTMTQNNTETEEIPSWDDNPDLGAMGPLPSSKKLNAVVFPLDEILPEGFIINDKEGKVEIAGGGQSFNAKLPGFLKCQLPCYGATGDVFSKTVNAQEAQGLNEFNRPFIGFGFVETPWHNGHGSGSFSTAMEAVCMGSAYNVIPTPVCRQMYTRQVREQNNIVIIPGALNVTWQLSTKPIPSKLQLKPVDPATYENWMPVPKFAQRPDTTPLAIMAEFVPVREGMPAPQGRIDFYLTDVSSHTGECCNAPRDRPMKDDLRFADEQADGIVIDPNNKKHAYTKDKQERAVVMISAEDGGAYGTLTARCQDQDLIAIYEATGTPYLKLPKDENNNHVADAWEKQEGIFGENLPVNWDEVHVTGQDNDGDGVSLYRKYRGFRVAGGDYVRLKPKKKSLFVIDNDGVFNTALWEKASDIPAYKVDDTLTQGGNDLNASRIVDFTMGDATGQHKYAVRLEVKRGLVEPVQYRNQPPGKLTLYGYTDQQGNSPRTAEVCRIFPDRLAALVDRMVASLQNAIKNPASDDGVAMANWGIPPEQAQAALDKLKTNNRAPIVARLITLCAIHEMGHACGIPGHINKGEEDEIGDDHCPMKYLDQGDRRWMILDILNDNPLPLAYIRFCTDQDFHCFAELCTRD